MRKRWGVRVIAILMLIAGVLLFLLGVAPAVLTAFRGAGGGLERYLAIPSVFVGCLAALPLVVVASILLTLGRISDNFASVSRPVPVKSAAPAMVALAAAPQAAPPELEAEAAPVAVSAQAGAEEPPAAEPVAAGALAAAAVGEELAGRETEMASAGEGVEEAVAAATTAPEAVVEEAEAPLAEELAVASVAAVQTRSPQEDIGALQAQLAALQAQLDELEGAPEDLEELPSPVEDEGPAPGAAEDVKLPGADDAARIAAEMAVLEEEPESEAAQEH